MKRVIVADESVDYRIIRELRSFNFEVYAICEQQPSINDKEVLDIASQKNAILITEDKDFGELVFRLNLPHRGVLLIRIEYAEYGMATAAETISKHYDGLYNKFSVLSAKKLRIKG